MSCVIVMFAMSQFCNVQLTYSVCSVRVHALTSPHNSSDRRSRCRHICTCWYLQRVVQSGDVRDCRGETPRSKSSVEWRYYGGYTVLTVASWTSQPFHARPKMGLDVEDLHAGYPACKQPTQCHTGRHTKYNDLCAL